MTHDKLVRLVIPEDLIRDYEAAHYWVDFPAGRIVLNIGQPFVGFDGFVGRNRLAIVTACNPFSNILADAENDARQALLIEAVAAAGLEWFPASGVDAQEKWVPEPSLAILDPSDEQLDGWMEAFEQNAVVVAEAGGPAALRLHPRYTTDSTRAVGEVPTPTEQTVGPKIEQTNTSPRAGRFEAAWGDGVHVQLTLSSRKWAKVQAGKPLTVRGKGYGYEGEFFWDYWDFSGGMNGELAVRYGRPNEGDYSAVGWDGTVGEALLRCDIQE